jgi:hypothetical protein
MSHAVLMSAGTLELIILSLVSKSLINSHCAASDLEATTGSTFSMILWMCQRACMRLDAVHQIIGARSIPDVEINEDLKPGIVQLCAKSMESFIV